MHIRKLLNRTTVSKLCDIKSNHFYKSTLEKLCTIQTCDRTIVTHITIGTEIENMIIQ